jgi:hypothetical protein
VITIATDMTQQKDGTVTADKKNMRIRLDEVKSRKWEELLASHKITQQDAIESAVDFLIDSEPLVRALIFRQVPDADRREIAKLVLSRMAGVEPRFTKLIGESGRRKK